MERNIHTDEFEDYLKTRADQYKMYPSDKLWDNIHRSIHPSKKWPYISLTILMLLGTAIFVDHYHYTPSSAIRHTAIYKTDFKTSSAPLAEPITSIPGQSAYMEAAESENNGHQVKTPASTTPGTSFTGQRHNIQPVFDDGEDYILNSENQDISTGTETLPVAGKMISKTEPGEQQSASKDDKSKETEVRKVLWGGEPFKKSKFEWQLFFSPTLSYRKLTSGVSEIKEVFRGIPYSTVEESTSVSDLVTHKAAAGAEVGANLVYKVTDNFLLKTGLQLNYSRYQLKAFVAKPEETTLAVINKPSGVDSINVISTLQNYSGRGASWFNNEYFQISMPVGFEWSVIGNATLRWNIAASAQPVYNFANNVYLLSTDFSRYGQDPSLIRKWNINAGVETFVSYNMGSFRWQAGPQLRYQLMSSYKSQYPVKEYLVDFGFKIGVTKTFK